MTGLNSLEVTADNPDLTLSIDDLRLGVICPDESLCNQLNNRYGGFLSPDKSVDCVKINLGKEEFKSNSVIPDSKYEGGKLRLCSRSMQGFFDLQTRYGELTACEPNQANSVEYYLRAIFATLAYDRGGILFHSAGIVRKGVCYVFFGHSGSGKTTIASLSPDDKILNDDLILLMPGDNSWFASGTPFSNLNQDPGANTRFRVAGLLRLVKDEKVYLEKVKTSLSVAECLANVPIISGNPALADSLMQRCQNLVTGIPTYRLHFRKDPSFWYVIERTLPG